MKTLFFILSVLYSFSVFSQGLIVNEFSNGTSGNREYIEFVVIGSSSNPTGNVNLSGWIIDDNNGDFNGNISNVGIAPGHIKISSGCLTSVKPGSIILIYNSLELSFTNDVNDSNNDCIYIIPISSTCLENTSDLPISTNPNYTPVNYTAIRLWDRISLANSGDAVQVRTPTAQFYHGFSYGTVDTIYPNFPMEFGGAPSFNIPSTGTGMAYFFNCGNFTSSTNFTRASATTNETPGAPNNNQNRYFINSIRNGTYDYSNLSNATNCGSSATLSPCLSILPLELNYFKGTKSSSKVILEWQTYSESEILYFEVERSRNGIDWYSLGAIEATNSNNWSSYEMYDYSFEDVYYRLNFVDFNGNKETLKTIFLEDISKENIMFSNEGVLVSEEFLSFELYLLDGSLIESGEIKDNFIRTAELPLGSYIVSLRTKSNTINKLFIK